MRISRPSIATHHLLFTTCVTSTLLDSQDLFLLTMDHGQWKTSRNFMVRWRPRGTTRCKAQMSKKWWDAFQAWQDVKPLEFSNSVSNQTKKLISLTLLLTLVLMFFMKQTKLMFVAKLWLIQRERKLKFSGHQAPMMRWLKWFLAMLQFGKCTKTLGIQFQENFQCVFILITIWECLIPGLNMSRTPELTTWWLKIKFTSQKMRDHSLQRRTPTAQVKDGGPKKILKKKTRCATPTGTPKAPITTSTTSQTSSVPKTKKL